MPREPLGGFVLRTFAWLPICLAAWYAVAPYHAALAGAASRVFIDAIAPNVVTGIEREGGDLDFVTRIVIHPEPDTTGVVVPEVNALVYTYGLAFFVALMLASRARWWMLLVGAIALLPFQAWGIAFDFLVKVGVRLGPEISAQAGLAGGIREALALGYQLGSLIFPTVVPVVLWIAFNRPFLERVLASARERRLSR